MAHFADRYGDFIIICLGESIVSIGVGVSATGHRLSVALVGTAGLGLMIALGMWWTYFDRLAAAAQERLRGHDDPVIVAADSYSYLHLVIVAGVIIYASGIRMVVHGALSPPMPTAGRLAFCGGVALYLAGVAAFRLRMLGEPGHGRIVVAVALLVLFAVGGSLPAWTITATVTVLILGLCVLDSLSDRRRSAGDTEDDGGAHTATEPAARVADPSRGPA